MIGPFMALNCFDIPLFALNAEEVIPVVIFIVIAIIMGITQYVNKQKEEAARQRRLEAQARRRAELAEMEQREQDTRPYQRQRPFGEPQPPKPAAPVDDEVAAELRDFLERAATGRAPTSPKPTPPVVAAPIEPAEEKHVPLADRPTRHSSLEKRSVPTSHTVDAEIIIEPPTTQERRRAEAVRAKKQAAAAAQARSAEKQKGRSKFDHQVGSLQKRTHTEKAGHAPTLTPATMANDIAVMFASTENIRQAIVINEILTRPIHRWE
ncbi:MAG: hypothetical protein PVH19_09975 [Planctomycetia bacterium]|jgi:hypothetical protein